MSDSEFKARYGVALIQCPQRNSVKISDEIWSWPGCQGLEELPEANAEFYVPSEDFEILEFGSEAAEKCAEWLDSGAFQKTHFHVFLKVYFSLAADVLVTSPDDLRTYIATEGKKIPYGCDLLSWNELPDTDYLEN
ncbi:MAG: hypothetical protein ABIR96_00060, partial [Bdellovibrionota bacterium]